MWVDNRLIILSITRRFLRMYSQVMCLVVGFYLLKHFYYKDEYKELCKIN